MKREKELLIFDQALNLYKHLGLPGDCIDDSIEFSILNRGNFPIEVPYTSPTYRANFYSFVFIKNSKGSCSSDDHRFKLQPGTVFFNNPGHIKQFSLNEVKELYLLTMSEAFLKQNVHASIFEEFPFLLAESVPPRVLNPDQFSEFEQLYLQIQKVYTSGSPYRSKLIGHLFVVLLLKIKESFRGDYDPVDNGNKSSQIVKTFKKDLETHYRQLVQDKANKVFRVQNYASLQSLHPNYLSNVIKTKTGKTVSSWIAEKTIAEAKSLLQNSSTPIKQIASLLGFTEATHFSNYFKKNTNTSPAYYRKGAS
jgi:AraC family transcriptional regulator, transcriptional activator of pobA